MTHVRTDYEKAMLDPTSVFHHPAEIVARRDFSQRQKIEVLRSWEYDARELDVAEEENMGGGESGELLDQILEALRLLGAHPVDHAPAPTKHGGS
ncbi:MAG: hypothetical protein R3286_02195 [Gammaproteobacteria bacterium]|nr:hypothetical protein [Gammaproteobacteria bacterium]